MLVVEVQGQGGPFRSEHEEPEDALLAVYACRGKGIRNFTITGSGGESLTERQLAMLVMVERLAKARESS